MCHNQLDLKNTIILKREREFPSFNTNSILTNDYIITAKQINNKGNILIVLHAFSMLKYFAKNKNQIKKQQDINYHDHTEEFYKNV